MRRLTVALLVLTMSGAPAFAHAEHGTLASFQSGLLHPLSGLDHLAAMIAVGVWAAVAGGRRQWLWPASFVAAMIGGGALGLLGVGLPYVEPMIGVSVLSLGLLVALAVKAPVWIGSVVVAAFAMAHGFAHGVEIGGADVGGYVLGFAAATAALHGVGIALALIGSRTAGRMPARGLGAVTALVGVALLMR
jgi:urease accessory protein